MRRAKHRISVRAARVAIVGLLLTGALAVVAGAQAFGEASPFGGDERPGEFTAVDPQEHGYFIHDQPIKIAIVGGLSILAVLVLAKRGFRHRKWLLLLSIGLVGFYLGGVLCPVSSVQNILVKWNTGYLLLFLIPVLGAMLVGRVFCGSVCPFGAIQELLHIKRWAITIPPRWRRGLGALKYVLLAALVARVVATGTPVLAGYTPFKALFAWGGTAATLALTAAVAVLSVVLWRPFCRFLCPLGAFLSIISRFSLFRIEAESSCVACGRCTTECPAAACDGGRIRSSGCFLCGACVQACPMSSLRFVRRWFPRRARGTESERSEGSGFGNVARSVETNPRIEHGVEDVDDEVRQQEKDAVEQRESNDGCGI